VGPRTGIAGFVSSVQQISATSVPKNRELVAGPVDPKKVAIMKADNRNEKQRLTSLAALAQKRGQHETYLFDRHMAPLKNGDRGRTVILDIAPELLTTSSGKVPPGVSEVSLTAVIRPAPKFVVSVEHPIPVPVEKKPVVSEMKPVELPKPKLPVAPMPRPAKR
jgi:hypothetical protein